jgi:DinB family protein
MDDLEKQRYPVGRLPRIARPLEPRERAAYIDVLADAPAVFRGLVAHLTDAQLDAPYRPGGWTIRQVVHHVPDSHLNAYIRMKLAATEDLPVVKTYREERWAELPEARHAPIAMSLDLLDALHRRWVAFLRELPEAAFRRSFKHAEWGDVTIEESVSMYAWHCRHHAAHIRMGLGIRD